MFEGVHQDQFHQFLAAAASNSTPISSSSSTSHHHLLQQQQQPTPLSFSLLHGCNPSSSPSPSLFHHDPYNNNNNPVQLHPHQHILHQQQIQWAPPSDAHTKQHHHQINGGGGGGGGVIKQERPGEAGFLAMERQRSMVEEEEQQADLIDSTVAVAWSHDELLALLRIRSALENWFPEFTWEHVSRKLSELGFKRSPQKCKERFEEESRSYFHAAKNSDVTPMENDVSCPTSKNNYRLFSELEELCHHRHDPPPPPLQPPHHHHHHHHHHQQQQQQQQSMDVINPREVVNVNQGDAVLDKQNPQREEGRVEDDSEQDERVKSLDENNGSKAIDKADEQENMETHQRYKKDRVNKKKKKKFEIFKTFCEEIVSKMMSHQEDLHKKILQDMIKRDEEKIAREEAWKHQEMERINKEMEARARDLAMVSDRQAKIIDFLKKFASDSSTNTMITSKKDANNEAPKSTHQNPSSSATHSSPNHLPTSSNEGSISQSSNPTKNRPNARKPRPNKRARSDNCSDGNDIGKRWPRDEVLALISIRCNIDLGSKTGPEDSGQNRNNSNSSNKNPPLWERISHKMVEMGYSRSAKRCKEKWENINKYFRKTKDMNKNRSVDSRTCPYFHQLNHLYNQGRAAEGGGGAEGRCGGGSGSGGGAMNVDISDQGEDASGVQVTLSAACDLEF